MVLVGLDLLINHKINFMRASNQLDVRDMVINSLLEIKQIPKDVPHTVLYTLAF